MITTRTSRPSFPGAGERARLSINGVRTPVGVRVARRREDAVTLVQELPFLALGNRVTDDAGRSGTISRVAVSIDHGVPRLVIELAYDEATPNVRPPRPPAVRTPEPSSERRRDATLGYDQRPSAPDLPRTVRMRRDDTNREMTLTFRAHTPYANERVRIAPPPAPRAALIDVLLGRFVAFAAMLVALISPRTT